MKKILLVALLVLLPLSAYALVPMADGNLDEITAQEGVRITIGGGETAPLVINQTAADFAWENQGVLVEAVEGEGDDPDTPAVMAGFSILMDVDEVVSNGSKISIWGDLLIQATKLGVELTLPSITSENLGTKTKISLGVNVAIAADGTLSHTGPSGVLGTMYEGGGLTEILGNSKIIISAMHD